jgi:hypothetical protein
MLRRFCLLATLATGLLAGCDMLGIESPERIAALKEADGKAVGGGCRHAGRAIEDCYVLNRKVEKAAIFAGWREMNDYMRENKLEPVLPTLNTDTVAQAEGEGKRARTDKSAEKGSDKAAEKQGEKSSEKGTDKSGDKARTKDSGAVMSEKSRKGES